MSRLLAIEWDEKTLSVLVISSSGDSHTIEKLGAIPLREDEDTAKEVEASEVAKKLSTWLSENSLGKLPVVAVVDRSQVELHELKLPPAPKEELPDLVKYQVQKDLSALGEDAPIDFMILSGGETEPYRILAATMARSVLTKAEQVCSEAGLKLRRVVLRPCASASFAERYGTKVSGVQLIAHPTTRGLDMAVVSSGVIQMIRSVMLGLDDEGNLDVTGCYREIRRTIAAARQQIGENSFERIAVCGSESQLMGLEKKLNDSFDLHIDTLDAIKLAGNEAVQAQVQAGSLDGFAALVGAAANEAAEISPVIDFLHPKERPVEKANNLRIGLLAGVAALLLLSFGAWQYMKLADLDASIDQTEMQTQEYLEKIKLGEKDELQAYQIAKWKQKDVQWLDELERLSVTIRPKELDAKDFPSKTDTVLTQLDLNSVASGGKIKLSASTKGAEEEKSLIDHLRNKQHLVDIIAGTTVSKIKGYDWAFITSIRVNTPPVLPPRK